MQDYLYWDTADGKRKMWPITSQGRKDQTYTALYCYRCAGFVSKISTTIKYSRDEYILIDKPRKCAWCKETIRPVGKREYQALLHYFRER